MKKELYRKSQLEKISTLDQLDKMLKITSPMSWLALLGVTAIILYVVVWSFTGNLASTVSATGMIVSTSTATNTIRSDYQGTVDKIYVQKGTSVLAPDNSPVQLMSISYNGVSQPVYVDSDSEIGSIAEVCVKEGAEVKKGDELFRISPEVSQDQRQVAVCYVPSQDIGKIKLGQEVTVTLTSADSSTYGHMTGRVINIDTQPTTKSGIECVVGADNGMYSVITSSKSSVCAVTCELMADPGTASGYKWSNKKGEQQSIEDHQMCTVRIVTENKRPIEKAFAKLKEIWGQ